MLVESGVSRHRSIGERFRRAALTGELIWGGTVGMFGVSSPPPPDFSEFDLNTSRATLMAEKRNLGPGGEISREILPRDVITSPATNETICNVPDPDKDQPGSFVGMSRFFLKGRGTINWVKADIELRRLQGRSSSPDDPKDGSVWVMLTGYGTGNFIQVGIINRGDGNRIFSARAHKLGSVDGTGTYCETDFGEATGSYTFTINHYRGVFYLKKNGKVIQRISEAALGWSNVSRAAIYAETHGPREFAKPPVSLVKNVKISDESALYGSQSAGPVGIDAWKHTTYYHYYFSPNKLTGFLIHAY